MTHLIESVDQFDQLNANQPIHVLYFSTPTCSVCQSVYPQLVNLMEAFPFPIFKINAEQMESLAGQHLVFTVPTILVMHEGKEVLRESRFIDFSKIQRILTLLKD